jgi:hypothetical protein
LRKQRGPNKKKIGVVSHPYSNFSTIKGAKRGYFFFAAFFAGFAAFFAGFFAAFFAAIVVSLLSLVDSLTTR